MVVLLLHACGLLAFLHVCRDGEQYLHWHSGQHHSRCKDNETCWKRVVDYLPESFLVLEVGFALKWVVLVVAAGYLLYIAAKIYQALFSRIDDVYPVEERDSGYYMSPGRTKRDMANLANRYRQVGDIPPVYPNGWYEIMRSEELAVGSVKAVNLVGQQLAVFRGESGKVSILDAYCPHVGANLGVGGRVRGDCIQCPFHGWCFDGQTGQCTEIPYSEKVPSFAKTKVWTCVEVNGLILVWYDAEGREPNFHIDQYEEIKSKQWTYRGRIVHYVNTHIEEISANGADLSHFPVVHETGVVAGTSVDSVSSRLANILTHHWNAGWEPLPPPNSQKARLTLSVTNKLFGWTVKLLNAKVEALQNGPSMIHLTFKSFLGNGVWVETVVPEGPMSQRLTTYVFADWWAPTFIVNAILRGMGTQIERDVHLWTNKTYRSKPLLVKSKEDGTIATHRRWFSQFYSENSTRFSFKNEDLSW